MGITIIAKFTPKPVSSLPSDLPVLCSNWIECETARERPVEAQRSGGGREQQKLTPQGKENELRDALAEAAPIYRKDPGTLGWHVLSGKKDAKGSFVAVERYENAQAIQTHASNPVS